MMFTTLITPQELADQLAFANWVVVDCRFSLVNTGQGRRDYLDSHIAGAVYAHLDDDLSGPIIPGETGRHPLPDIETLVQTLSAWGIGNNTQVVAYDDLGGAIAARLWWMLRWLGHQAAAVLDGGWQAWHRGDYPVAGGAESNEPRTFIPNPRPELLLQAEDVDKIRKDPTYRLFDARRADRFVGENETLDPVAGHIPGAASLPFADNLAEDKTFLPADQLKASFIVQLGDVPAEQSVFYCGSGVTAAHGILAMLHAGLGEARLYAGSWSEWITDTNRPVARGSK